MFRRTSFARQLNTFASTSTHHPPQRTRLASGNQHAVAGATIAVAATVLWLKYGDHDVIQNDSSNHLKYEIAQIQSKAGIVDEEGLDCLVWGSNEWALKFSCLSNAQVVRNSLLVPDSSLKSVKTPIPSPALINTALRDLKVSEAYGACIDARGDVYEWGPGYSKADRRPQKVFSGKVSIA
jgi:hypothetical protein